MGDIHRRLLGTALAKLDKISEEGRARRSFKAIDKHLRLLKQGESTFRNEVIASHLMKQLTSKFGSRGKTPKFVFLQAFEEELRGGSTPETEKLKNVGLDKPYLNDERDADEKDDDDDLIFGTRSAKSVKSKTEPKTMADMLTMRSGHLGPIIVSSIQLTYQYHGIIPILFGLLFRSVQPQWCHTLYSFTNWKRNYDDKFTEIPTFDAPWLFEETKQSDMVDDSLTYYDTMSVRESVEETEDTMLRRLKLYKRAFSALILHFEALRPVLRDIKKCYDHVLNVRDDELREAKITKQNVEHYKKTLDLKNANIEFEGVDELAELQQQSLLLLKHIDRQESTIGTMNEILNYLEIQLTEEHDLRHDAEDQQKLLLIGINDYRHKLGMEPRTQDYASEISMKTLLENTDEKEEEALSRPALNAQPAAAAAEGEPEQIVIPRDMSITTEDILILRKSLEIARNDLEAANAKIASLEESYGAVIPRTEFLKLKQQMTDLEAEDEKRKNTFSNFGEQVEALNAHIEKLTQERTKLSDELEELQGRVTPRPSWAEFAQFIDGGTLRWNLITEGMSSDAIAEKLFLELTMEPSGSVGYIPSISGAGSKVSAIGKS